jgi:hypothetical protein
MLEKREIAMLKSTLATIILMSFGSATFACETVEAKIFDVTQTIPIETVVKDGETFFSFRLGGLIYYFETFRFEAESGDCTVSSYADADFSEAVGAETNDAEAVDTE